MPFIDAKIIREKLTTAFARAAFDKLNAMKPKWYYSEEGNKVFLMPDIHTKKTWDCIAYSLGVSAETADDIVIKTLLTLQEEIGDQDKVAVVDLATTNKKEFTYHSKAGIFVPYEPKRS